MALAAFRGERSISGVYHLLTGKKSTQTIQDGSYFSILSLFGVFPSLKREQLLKIIEKLVEQEDATYKEKDRVALTGQGTKELEKFLKERPQLDQLHGWRYHSYTNLVWLRICLLIQTLSHLVAGNRTFYPITHRTEVRDWVKRILPPTDQERKKQLHRMYYELSQFLSGVSELSAFVIVHQLTGRTNVGLTHQQLAAYLHTEVLDVYLTHLMTLHSLFNTLENDAASYPVLSLFIQDLKQEMVLTDSARKTYDWFLKGKTIKEISRIRNLKENTIDDHIVEISLQDQQFSIRPFVAEEYEREIKQAMNSLHTSRLRDLKEMLPPEISYFMIRLVVSRKESVE